MKKAIILKCVIGFTLMGFTFVAVGQTGRQSVGAVVKAAIEKKNKKWVSQVDGGVLRTMPDSWSEPLTNMQYNLTHCSSNFNLGTAGTESRYFTWNKKGGSHSDEVRVLVSVSTIGTGEARDNLFNLMGQSTTMMITPETFILLENGPGDVCFVMSSSIKKEHDNPVVMRKIWFCRDNFSVELSSSGDTDLLLIARSIDSAIMSCPVKTR